MAAAGVISEEESLIPKKEMTRITSTGKKKSRKKKKRKRRITCWSMITNFKFLYFVMSTISTCGLFLWWYALYPDAQIPYVISGIVGLLVSVTGYRTFNELIALTAQSNVFEKNNTNMRDQRRAIRKEVHNIKYANQHLRNTELRLRAANEKNKQNLNNFREVQSFMQTMNIEDFEEVTKKAQTIGASWQQQCLQEERTMLHLIFDRYEMNHEKENEKGMNEEQFNQFAATLPDAYCERFARLGTFGKLSNNTGILEYADFRICMDVFAEMVVNDTDIDVDIVKSAANLHDVPSMEEARYSTYTTSGQTDTDDEDDERNAGSGFFDRLTTWRKTRKKSKMRLSGAEFARQLVVKPKDTKGAKVSSKFNAFEVARKEEEKEKKAESAKKKLTPPKHMKTKSQIEAIHNIDECSLDDDEINAYMAAHQ